MKKYSEDFIPLPATFGEHRPSILGGKPAMNIIESIGTAATLSLYASLAATAASTAVSVSAQQTAAKQAEMNAEAQSKALLQEKQRQQLEFEENRRRVAQEQKRFRATQLARIANSGIVAGTGTALELEADTWRNQAIELKDRSYVNQLGQQQLAYKAGSVLQMGRNEANNLRQQSIGTAIGGVASMAGQVYGALPTKGTTTTPTTTTPTKSPSTGGK